MTGTHVLRTHVALRPGARTRRKATVPLARLPHAPVRCGNPRQSALRARVEALQPPCRVMTGIHARMTHAIHSSAVCTRRIQHRVQPVIFASLAWRVRMAIASAGSQCRAMMGTHARTTNAYKGRVASTSTTRRLVTTGMHVRQPILARMEFVLVARPRIAMMGIPAPMTYATRQAAAPTRPIRRHATTGTRASSATHAVAASA